MFIVVISHESQKITIIVQFAFRKGLDKDEPLPVEGPAWHKRGNVKLFAIKEIKDDTSAQKIITPQLPDVYEQRLVAFVDLLGFSASSKIRLTIEQHGYGSVICSSKWHWNVHWTLYRHRSPTNMVASI